MDLIRIPEQGKIGPLQAGMLAIALTLPTSVLYIPSGYLVVTQAGRDAWLSVLLAMAAAVIIVIGIWHLSLRHPGRTYIQILEIEWGPWVGRALAALTLLGMIVHGATLLRGFSEAVGLTILPRTPVLAIATTEAALAVFVARRGIEVIARINQIAIPLLLLSLLVLFALSWNDIEWKRLPPFFQTPMESVLRGAIWPLGWFLQLLILAQIAFPFVHGLRRAGAPLIVGITITGCFAAAALLIGLAVLGVYEAVHSIGIVEKLAREVRPVAFLSRTEALYLFFWQAASFVEFTGFLYAATLTGAQLFGLRDYHSLAAPLGLLSIVIGSLLFRSLPDLVRFTQQVFPVYALLLGGAIPLSVLAFSFRPRPVGAR